MGEYTKKPENQSRTLDSNPKASRQAPIDVILQRYKERNIQRYVEDEELIQGKFNDTVQRNEIEKDELLQGKFECTSKAEQDSAQRKEKPNNTGLPNNLKLGIENLSGYNMDNVKVHYNSDKPSQLQALAYTQGTDIHVASGQKKHLPHEAWHVVQQKQGRVQPTTQLQGVNVNDNQGLEKEADEMGGKAIQFRNKFQNVQIENIGSVAQLAHIQDLTELVPTPEDTELYVTSTKPTMVFESMSINKEDLKAIFEESKKYNGNTICVVGLNCKADKDLGELPAEEHFTDANNNRHLFYYFTFRWTATSEDPLKNKGYPIPFIEARLEIMNKAKQVTDQITRQEIVAHKFLYRWIDGDAKDDTSNDMSTHFLKSIANSEKEMIVTGKYDWRTENISGVNETSQRPQDKKKKESFNNYNDFITRLNTIEKQLRNAYYLVSDKKAVIKLSTTDTSGNGYLPGFYLPETSFIMNESAHKKAIEEYGYKQFGSEPQDKESMKVTEMISPEYIVFHSGLSVTKPLKGENTDSSYLSKELKTWILKEPTRTKPRDKNELITGLKNLRQSAFDNQHWFYINNSTWQKWEIPGTPDKKKKDEVNQENFNIKRRELAENLYKAYKDKPMDIGQART